jgi:hypothetical protein
MKGVEHAGKGAARKPGKAAAASRRPAAKVTAAPAGETAAAGGKRRRIDPVGKFLLENRGALGADHTLDL